ncbi:Zinc resistance conferring protein [Basidiobolus ranarum]|uniref:Zinc resistance conferring protein n=1 Tax=Basidiobolus ranarum TaxID=34480 RepID=A0ABR2WF63_9FUNG
METADRVKKRRDSLASNDETPPILSAVNGDEGTRVDGRLNMQSIFLHVLGDTLGSVAEIISAVVIWKFDFPQRYLLDPIISLLITGIILAFSLPLVKSTCFILLQGVPSSIPVEIIREQISNMQYVHSVHELHIWQLNDIKTVASIHVCLEDAEHYLVLAEKINELLRAYGVESITIQPEFRSSEQGRDFKCPATISPSTYGPPRGTD